METQKRGTDIGTDQLLSAVSVTVFLIFSLRLLRAFSILVLPETSMQSAATCLPCWVTVVTWMSRLEKEYESVCAVECLPIKHVGGCDVKMKCFSFLSQT